MRLNITVDGVFYNTSKILALLNNYALLDVDLDIVICGETEAQEYYNKYFPGVFKGVTTHRGFFTRRQQNPLIVIYYSRYEDQNSVDWLVLHEVTHFVISQNRLLKEYFNKKEIEYLQRRNIDPEEYYSDFSNAYMSDQIHEGLPEEVFANDVATRELDRCDYSRKWWRERIEEEWQRRDLYVCRRRG